MTEEKVYPTIKGVKGHDFPLQIGIAFAEQIGDIVMTDKENRELFLVKKILHGDPICKATNGFYYVFATTKQNPPKEKMKLGKVKERFEKKIKEKSNVNVDVKEANLKDNATLFKLVVECYENLNKDEATKKLNGDDFLNRFVGEMEKKLLGASKLPEDSDEFLEWFSGFGKDSLAFIQLHQILMKKEMKNGLEGVNKEIKELKTELKAEIKDVINFLKRMMPESGLDSEEPKKKIQTSK